MATTVITFLATAAVIVVAGTFLTRCADVIAQRAHFGRMLGGIVFLAAATSLPELFVNLSAVQLRAPNLAVGDLLGATLMNLLTLSMLDLLHYSRGKMLSRTSAAHALSGTMSISLLTLVAIGILCSKELAPFDVVGVGIMSWAVLAVLPLGLRLVFFDQKLIQNESSATPPGDSAVPIRRAVAGYIMSAAAILAAAPFLARSAARLAGATGLGDTFFGTCYT